MAADLIKRWLPYVSGFDELFTEGSKLTTVPGAAAIDSPTLPLHHGRHPIVICSPHPDDEALYGGLPLRLQDETHHVLNLAITLGSNPARMVERKKELAASCGVLGFDCRLAEEPLGFVNIASAIQEDTSLRQRQCNMLTDHFNREMPDLIVFPHADDHHPTHMAVHHLSMAAARQHSRSTNRSLLLAETEFWHPMKNPNLLLGLSPEIIARIIAALVCHQGEVSRNPYHLSLPARLLDNVRRGAELLRFPDGPRPQYRFAEIYRVSRLDRGRQKKIKGGLATAIPPDSALTLADLLSL